MRVSPALQASDLLAWFSNRYWSKGRNDPWGGLYAGTFLLTPHYHGFVDSRAICSIYDSNGSMRPGVQIAMRRRLNSRDREGPRKELGDL